MRKLMTFLAVAVAITLSTGISLADPIGPDCTTCQGSIYLLQYDPNNTGTDPVTGDSIYDVFLTIDTTTYDFVTDGNFIDSVSIKISDSVDVATSSLVSAPGGAGAWTLQFGGINAGGCDGAGSGFICASDGQTAPADGSTWTWEFLYETADPLGAATIKARYVDGNGAKVGALVSEDITLQPCGAGSGEDCGGGGGGGGNVPEPGSIFLLGSGLLLASIKLRKKLARS
jgi:hypothetical protein